MTRALAVTARELRERWLLFPVALAVGCIPLVLPWLGVPRAGAPVAGLMAAVLLGGIAGLVVGASMLTRDGASGRLGFLFSRPVSATAIWGGKWVAAVLLVVVSGLLAALPWMAVFPPETQGGSWLRAMLDPQAVFVLVVVSIVVGLSNFGSTAYRSRSPWIAVDIVALLVAAWAAARYVAPLYVMGMLTAGPWVAALTTAPVGIALLAGSAAQVSVGRTDIQRAHRTLSLVFWSVVFAAIAAAAGWLRWIEATGPADLRSSMVSAGADGRWLFVEGQSSRAQWYFPGFLLDASTGRYLQTTPTPSSFTRHNLPGSGNHGPFGGQTVSFSGDSRFAAYWEPDRARGSTGLVFLELTAPGRVRRVALAGAPPPGWSTAVALSPTGAHALLVRDSAGSLYELPTGRLAASCPLAPGWRAAAARFLDETTARVWLVPLAEATARDGVGTIRIAHVGPGRCTTASFELSSVSQPAGSVPPPVLIVDREGSRVLTRSGTALDLRDGATGALRATLIAGEAATARRGGDAALSARFLSDGRIAALARTATGTVLRTFTENGTPILSAEITPQSAWLGPELGPGRLAVGIGGPWARGSLVVDAGDGRVVQRFDDLTPTPTRWWLGDFTPEPDVRAATRPAFFIDRLGRLLQVDLSTGSRRVVAGPGAPGGERLAAQ